MADFVFKISPNILMGTYTTARLGQLVKEWGTRFMLILDPALKDYDVADKIQKSLTDRKIDFFVFDNILGNFDTEATENALKLAREAHIHGIICAGGTRVANIGRIVASLYNESHSVYDFIDGNAPTSTPSPLVVLPSIMRDEFLFTDRTPIVDGRFRRINLLKVQNGLCKLALFDPNLMTGLTENQLASISLQTLCIALESYLSQKANFFSDTIIEKGIEFIGYELNGAPALNKTTSTEMLMAQGGCMTSLGAALSCLGPASLLSLGISGRFGIQRSLATSILLPYFIEETAKYKLDKLARASVLMGIAASGTAPEAAVTALVDNIRNRIALANLPARLKDLSVSVEDLALAAEDASQLELMNGLPRSMTADDLFDLLKQAY